MPDKQIGSIYTTDQSGKIAIEKLSSGSYKFAGTDADTDRNFEFKATFSVLGMYSYKINGTGNEISFTSGDTLQLKHNQTAVFENFPVGMTYIYIVTETSTNKGGYTASVENTRGKIIPATASTTMPFDFTVTFSGDDAVDVPFAYTTNKGQSGTITNSGVISLTAGEIAIFKDIPAGCRAYAAFNNHK